MPVIRYTPEQNAYLRANYATASRAEIMAHFPNCAWATLQARAWKHKLPTRQVPGRFSSVWSPERLAILHLHYPLSGSPQVVALTGCTVEAVRKEAARRGLRAPRMPRPVAGRPLAAPTPKVVKAKPAPLLSVKRSAKTPNLNVAKEARRRAEEAPKRAAGITADAIRRLSYNDPQRMAYTFGGVAGWQQWRATEVAAGR